jgi:hypothetical protein
MEGGRRKLHNEGFHNLHSSLESMRIRLAWNVARKGEKRNANRVLVGKPD